MNELNERIAELVRQGRTHDAQRLLAGVLRQDPTHIDAWAMMAELVDNPQQEIDCLRRVLDLADDMPLREWAAIRLATLVNPAQPDNNPAGAAGSLHENVIPIPVMDRHSHPAINLRAVLGVMLVLALVVGFGIAGYLLLSKTNPAPGFAATLPSQSSSAPTSVTSSSRTLLTATNTPTLAPVSATIPVRIGIPEQVQALAEGGVTTNAGWTPYTQEINGVLMALIPVGCFQMGDNLYTNEQPIHKVCFDRPFWIDVYEVTNDAFESASNCLEFSSEPRQPRSCISWEDALAHCLARGVRLPTEAEWEYASRGPDGLVYPWGNTADCSLGNFDDTMRGCDGFPVTAPVGSFPMGASWIGALDMSGNVWEWVNDWYSGTYYGTLPDGVVNPSGPRFGERIHVARGNAWYDFDPDYTLRAAYRGAYDPSIGSAGLNGMGFRCGSDFPGPSMLPVTIATSPTITPIPTLQATLTIPQSNDASFDAIVLPRDPALGPLWDGERLVARRSNAYNAEFALEGVTLVYLDGEEVLSPGARFRLLAVRQDGSYISLPEPDPLSGNPDAVKSWLVQDNILLRERQIGLFEVAVLWPDYVELAYLLLRPPASEAKGDLELVIAIDTTLEIYADPQNFSLIDENGNGISIGQSTATDANGNNTPVAVEPDDEGMRIRISADWLDQAVYPIFIDPLVVGYRQTALHNLLLENWRSSKPGE